jgi:hypothetical protein
MLLAVAPVRLGWLILDDKGVAFVSDQAGRLTLLKSVALAGVTSAIGIFTNLVAGGSGNALSWGALALLTIVLGVTPYLGREVVQSRFSSARSRQGLLVVICLMLASTIIVDEAGRGRPGTITGGSKLFNKEGTAATVPVEPPRFIVEPSPLNPESNAVASRLTSALRDSRLVPDGLTLERGIDDSYVTKPLEFFVDRGGGRFVAVANLRDKLGVSYLAIEVRWSKDRSHGSECPPPSDTFQCKIETLSDGTRVTDSRGRDPGIKAEFETVTVVQSNGSQALVYHTNADRKATRKDLSLDVAHMVAIAKLGAKSLIEV